MSYKIRVRSKNIARTGKPGRWMVWAAFATGLDANIYADDVRKTHPTWDVQVYEGKADR